LVVAKCAKNLYDFIFRQRRDEGEDGFPRKSKVESLFSEDRDDDDPRVFNTFINNESARETRY